MSDLISRQAVDDAIYDYSRSCDVNYAQIMEYIDKIPSVTPQEPKIEKGIKMRDATPKERESVDKYVKSISKPTGVNFWDLEQEPKTGHWKSFTHSAYHGIDDDGEPIWREVKVYHCNLCNRRTVIKENYCPNCGADMRGTKND